MVGLYMWLIRKLIVAGTLLFNALKEAIDEEMANDVNVCVMGEDVGQYGGSYKVTKDLYEKYGELRVLDTPIAENSLLVWLWVQQWLA